MAWMSMRTVGRTKRAGLVGFGSEPRNEGVVTLRQCDEWGRVALAPRMKVTLNTHMVVL